jgi:hypothetical protein
MGKERSKTIFSDKRGIAEDIKELRREGGIDRIRDIIDGNAFSDPNWVPCNMAVYALFPPFPVPSSPISPCHNFVYCIGHDFHFLAINVSLVLLTGYDLYICIRSLFVRRPSLSIVPFSTIWVRRRAQQKPFDKGERRLVGKTPGL